MPTTIDIKKRQLGNSELEVSPLCFGGNVFGWTADEQTSFELLDGFVDAGFNFIDTADTYSTWVPGHQGGESEAIIGKWLKHSGKRADVIIATKLGKPMAHGGKGLSRAYMLSEVEESLRRLQSDYIDLYQAHEDDPNTPLEETLETFAQLMKAGKVRVIGASNYSGQRLAEALRVSKETGLPRYESLQPWYNLYDRKDYERTLEPVCEKERLGVIPYFSLGAGFLTGKYRSEQDLANRGRGGMVKRYLNERGFRVLDALESVSQRLQATPAQVALAWLMARPSVTAPIASATSVAQLKDITRAVEVKLDSESLEVLNRSSAE